MCRLDTHGGDEEMNETRKIDSGGDLAHGKGSTREQRHPRLSSDTMLRKNRGVQPKTNWLKVEEL